MPTDIPDNVEAKLAKKREEYQQAVSDEAWVDTAAEKIPIAYGFAARSARDVALYSVLTGEVEQARDWFANAADQYLAGARKRTQHDVDGDTLNTTPLEYANALYAAILADDRDRIMDIARAVRQLDREQTLFPNSEAIETTLRADHYWYAQGLATVVLADTEALTTCRTRLATANDANSGSIRLQYDGAVNYFDGILEDDTGTVESGLTCMLERFETDMVGAPASASDYIAVSVTALAALARRHGLTVTINSDFIPSVLVNTIS